MQKFLLPLFVLFSQSLFARATVTLHANHRVEVQGTIKFIDDGHSHATLDLKDDLDPNEILRLLGMESESAQGDFVLFPTSTVRTAAQAQLMSVDSITQSGENLHLAGIALIVDSRVTDASRPTRELGLRSYRNFRESIPPKNSGFIIFRATLNDADPVPIP